MKPLARIGIIADLQYADADEGHNFSRTVTRRYRHSIEVLHRACAAWYSTVSSNEKGGITCNADDNSTMTPHTRRDTPSVSCVLQLGDFIDGKCQQHPKGGGSLGALAEMTDVISEYYGPFTYNMHVDNNIDVAVEPKGQQECKENAGCKGAYCSKQDALHHWVSVVGNHELYNCDRVTLATHPLWNKVVSSVLT